MTHRARHLPDRSHGRRLFRSPAALAALAVLALSATPAHAALPGAAPELTRAPYLTDLTTTGVEISWATTTQSVGTVQWGPAGSCTANTTAASAAGTPITVNSSTEYQNNLTLTGLAPATSYCYRVFTGGSTPVDLLGQNPSPSFTTLEPPGSTTPFTFAVFGDWGDTTNGGVNDGSLNVNQANIDRELAASGARFAVSTGDVGYPGGTQNNYGDLNQPGINTSGVFGPPFWAAPGQTLPTYAVSANHGRNATFITNWPQTTVAATGVYAMTPYPAIDGAPAASYPTSYYAFDTGGVRVYMLDASWGDGNTGTASGGPCGSHCAIYQVDHDAHWLTSSAEYTWLAADLAQHPAELKIAAFHFPLRSDDATEPNDNYLLNTPGSLNSLEQLLHTNGVRLVFNGHAHDYQRNIAPPGGVISYVSGGGGAKLTPVSHCSLTDAYAIGWSYTTKKGSACGTASVPTTDAKVFHFLLVHVDGTTVTVTPTDSTGATFDVQTYQFAADTTQPTAPGALKATVKPTKTTLTWTASSDNIGVQAYDIYRNDIYLATVPATTTSYADPTTVAGTGYTYLVTARDYADNPATATVVIGAGGGDTSPPTAPTSLTATSAGLTSAALSWSPSTDNVGINQYTVSRNGLPIAAVTGTTTSYTDTGLTPGTPYTYLVTAQDAAGNLSPPSPTATMTTDPDTSPPTAPGAPTATAVTSSSVSLRWAAATDNVGVLAYDVVRDGTVLARASGTTFTDTTVAPGTTYTYAIVAWDAAGYSTTGPASPVTTPSGQTVFADGFETGDLRAWATVAGLTVRSDLVHTGSFAARETSTGTATYAYATLPASYPELWAQAWIDIDSHSTSATLLGYRTSIGASLVNLYLDTTGRLSLRNNIGAVTTYSTTKITAPGWHQLVLHALVNGTSSSLDVTLDGTPAPGLALTGQNLGTAPISKLQLGETATGRTYDITLDDITVSQAPI